MDNSTSIAVTSRSFSRHPILRKELLNCFSNVTFNDKGTSLFGQELVDFLKGNVRAITALEQIDSFVLSQLSELTLISKMGVGIDMIDMDAMKRFGVHLNCIGGTNRRSVAELVLAFSVILLRNIVSANREILAGTWKQKRGRELSGKTFGIVGCGNVGKDLIVLLKTFNCKILCYEIADISDYYAEHGIELVELEDLLRQSDIVSLHLPLNDSTRNILDAKKLALMKPEAILINTARGGLVDEAAVKKMLKDEKLGGVAFDVFVTEPPDDTELLNMPNFLATPHIGGSTDEAILAMGRAAIAGLHMI